MGERILILEAAVPRFRRGVRFRFDQARDQWLIVAPERVSMPNQTAVEVLKLVDGAASVGVIADGLAERFQAPRELILSDVIAMLQDLADKGVLAA
ncbi:MAG: pyrroloquinoline quinone biosynthesis peptide chaperone PqqD [Azospirillum sp.]|nr:pyrroloquinoline quinone biosynthesis peptide chaperone PqqD [Azospirillum sp.]